MAVDLKKKNYNNKKKKKKKKNWLSIEKAIIK